MKQYSYKILLILLISSLLWMAGYSWAALPVIPKAIEVRFYQGSPEEIEKFIQEQEKQATQVTTEVKGLLKKSTVEKTKKTLSSSTELLQSLSFQFARLRSELKRPPDSVAIPPVTGTAPYSLNNLDETLHFYYKVKQRLSEHKKKKELLEEKLLSIKENLTQLLTDYVRLKNSQDLKAYKTLAELLSFQIEYALLKVQIFKSDQTADNLTSLEGRFGSELEKVFNNLKVTEKDVIIHNDQKKRSQNEEKDLKDKFIAKQRYLNQLIIAFESKLNNIITRLRSDRPTEASKELLRIEKRYFETRLVGLLHQKEFLAQTEIAARIDTTSKAFRYDWLAYYAGFPQSKEPQQIAREWTEQLHKLDKTINRLGNMLSQKSLRKSILNQNLLSVAQERKSATEHKSKETLDNLLKQINITNTSLDKLILKISDNLNNAKLLGAEIKNILRLIQQRISVHERFAAWIRNNSLATLTRAKSIIYYPLWTIGESTITLSTLLKIVFLIFFGIIFLRVIRRRLTDFFVRKAWFSIGIANSLTTLSYYFLLFIVLVVAISTAGVNLSQITIILGALGVGIGFGLQTIVNNFLSGLILLTERTITVGDIIELQDGLLGKVEKISIRSTVIRTYDGLDIIVPNSDFTSNRVTSWTYGNDWRRLRIPFGVSYGSDPDEVASVATETARNIPSTIEDKHHPIQVWFQGFGESNLDFTLLVWCRLSRLMPKSGLISDYYFELFRKFKEAGIEIPFPQTDLHLRSISPEIMESIKGRIK